MKLNKKVFTLVLSGLIFSTGIVWSSALDMFEQGITKQNREDYYGAAEDFHQALQVNPSYGDAWFHLSEVTYAVGEYSLALTYLEYAEKYAKSRIDILNLRGMIYISLGKLDDAKKVFQSIIKNNPNDVNARFGLAEIDLYSGVFSGAKQLYLDALKRQNNNRKALLSLALLSSEEGKYDATQNYINQALKYHSGDPEVHYLAAYLSAREGDFENAERRVRAAVQIKRDFTKAYVLLADILYSQKRYDDTIDTCEYLISRNRKTAEAWYLKGLSQIRKNEIENAIITWTNALYDNPQDEVMRSALEILVIKVLPVEDVRRNQWAEYHVKKARDFKKSFMGEESRYEYQRALKIAPYNSKVRSEFADLISKSGLNELYLNQLKFIQSIKIKTDSNQSETKSAKARDENIVNDTIEAYDSLMKYSLSSEWNIDPFYLDKIRWNIGLYYKPATVHMIHPEIDEVASSMISDIFTGVATTSVVIHDKAVSGYGEAYRLARQNKLDYFVMLSMDETDREVSMDIVVYSGKTGTETTRFNYFRTGNDRFASVLRAFRRDLLDMLPVRGKIIQRSVNDLLLDLGYVEGMKVGTVLDVVKAGKISTVDKGRGVKFEDNDLLGKITVTRVGEEISLGTLEQNGFYDRVNLGDEILVRTIPKEASENDKQISDVAPAADENGGRILPDNSSESTNKKKLNAEELGLVKTPIILDLIRGIK